MSLHYQASLTIEPKSKKKIEGMFIANDMRSLLRKIEEFIGGLNREENAKEIYGRKRT